TTRDLLALSIQSAPIEAHVHVPRRALADFPRVPAGLPEATLTADLRMERSVERPTGTLTVDGTLVPPDEGRCAEAAPLDMHVEAGFGDGGVDVEVTALRAGVEGTLTARTPVPPRALIDQLPDTLPLIDGEAHVLGLELAQIPVA